MKKTYITPIVESISLDTECYLLDYSTGFDDNPANSAAKARENLFFEDEE